MDLSQYYIQSFNITDDEATLEDSTNGMRGVRVDFVLSRRLLSQMMTTMLPTFCICLVAFSTNYFQVLEFSSILVQLRTSSVNYIFRGPTSRRSSRST